MVEATVVAVESLPDDSDVRHILELSGGFTIVGITALRRLRHKHSSETRTFRLTVIVGGQTAAAALKVLSKEWGLADFVDVRSGDVWATLPECVDAAQDVADG